MAQRPLIGITGPQRGAWGPRLCIDLGIRLAGGKPLHLRPRRPIPDRLDGVVISGGHDIDPVLYAEESAVKGRYDQARDSFEVEVIRRALEESLPLLGVCRGAQLLNVCRGGTLFQDLRERRVRTSQRRSLLPLKTLCVRPNTRLGRLLARPRLRINSLHNQSIDRLGEGLQIAGEDLDGIVQAVEDPRADFVVGVQWHPEFLLYLGRQRRLFRALVRASTRASSRASTRASTRVSTG